MYILTIYVAYKHRETHRESLTHAQKWCVRLCVRIMHGYSLCVELFIDLMRGALSRH